MLGSSSSVYHRPPNTRTVSSAVSSRIRTIPVTTRTDSQSPGHHVLTTIRTDFFLYPVEVRGRRLGVVTVDVFVSGCCQSLEVQLESRLLTGDTRKSDSGTVSTRNQINRFL